MKPTGARGSAIPGTVLRAAVVERHQIGVMT
jgi:hypothetical protein